MPPRARRQPAASSGQQPGQQPGQRPRRAGARRGAIAPAVRAALREEARRLSGVPDEVERVRLVGDFFAALDRETERIAAVRLVTVGRLHRGGMSYEAIAAATGLSKSRVAQLVRE